MKNSDKTSIVFEHHNCAQTIFSLFATELGIPEQTALRIASGFGGGMNRGETCGAVTGAYMVIGLKAGHITSLPEEIAQSRELIEKFNGLFLSEHNFLKCSELLGHNMSNPDEREIAKAEGLFENRCPKFLKTSAKIIEDHF